MKIQIIKKNCSNNDKQDDNDENQGNDENKDHDDNDHDKDKNNENDENDENTDSDTLSNISIDDFTQVFFFAPFNNNIFIF